MKAELPKPPVHHSYKRHRRQLMRQIIMPVVASAVLMVAFVALISYSTFYDDGDVSRWAQISTMWVLLPVIISALLVLALLVAIIYYLALGLAELPKYTGIAQDYVYHARTYIVHGARAAEKPVRFLKSLPEKVQDFFNTYMP